MLQNGMFNEQNWEGYGELNSSAVADPGFLQGGFKIHERARSARENFTATPPFNKTTPF